MTAKQDTTMIAMSLEGILPCTLRLFPGVEGGVEGDSVGELDAETTTCLLGEEDEEAEEPDVFLVGAWGWVVDAFSRVAATADD